MKQITIDDDILKEIIKNSISWSEAMRKCGREPKGGSFQYFQARVKSLNIDTSHFLGKAAHTGFRHTGKARKKTWHEILVNKNNNIRHRSKELRRAYDEYCIENNIAYKCKHCGNDSTWKGKKLLLEIDHIDNNRGNNSPNNLEWNCPNCHSVKTYQK